MKEHFLPSWTFVLSYPEIPVIVLLFVYVCVCSGLLQGVAAPASAPGIAFLLWHVLTHNLFSVIKLIMFDHLSASLSIPHRGLLFILERWLQQEKMREEKKIFKQRLIKLKSLLKMWERKGTGEYIFRFPCWFVTVIYPNPVLTQFWMDSPRLNITLSPISAAMCGRII